MSERPQPSPEHAPTSPTRAQDGPQEPARAPEAPVEPHDSHDAIGAREAFEGEAAASYERGLTLGMTPEELLAFHRKAAQNLKKAAE